MEFLARCAHCGVVSYPEHLCPGREPETTHAVEHLVELERRRERHRSNYVKFMGVTVAWAVLTMVIEVKAVLFDHYFSPVWTILNIFSITLRQFLLDCFGDVLLGIAWLLLTVAMTRCRSWWPIEVLCPRCEQRLDDLGMKMSHCPGCQLWLG